MLVFVPVKVTGVFIVLAVEPENDKFTLVLGRVRVVVSVLSKSFVVVVLR